jgi:hypothetical protein
MPNQTSGMMMNKVDGNWKNILELVEAFEFENNF